jgi:hypothetical protein
MIETPIQTIGDKWAKNISDEFQSWADEVAKTGRANTKIIRFDPTPLIESAFYEGGEAQLGELGKILGTGIKFDITSPEAIAWIKEYGANQITLINDTTKATIRDITRRGLEEGLSPQEQSKLIRQHIGILPQHAKAAENYRKALLDSGMDQISVERLVAKRIKFYIKLRADNIGLTESHTATNEGSRQVNENAVERGIISKDEYEQEWLTAADDHRCSKCGGMQGKRAAIGGNFPGDGRGPPLHNRCRCTNIVVAKSSKPYMPKVAERKEESKVAKEPKESKKGVSLKSRVTDELAELTIKGSGPTRPGEILP